MDLVMLNVERWRHGMDAGMMDVSMALGILALAVSRGLGRRDGFNNDGRRQHEMKLMRALVLRRAG
eukprot:CAMPEP_0201871968 /NCGR_PEP_ID=MMETSP0902-20130614/4780_1 /ASSEMBLY_ACC=CAM_ASM_000551 /TAXON_ID=420261 /ORGANISM="Thalassiosira antarctica, Strain CCMP982" /LENGTH=65 /DNA_ID=CAMNT_0048398119 /DNA_START=95 /DNA_END=289 /DNA_ORIENTATION=-